MIRSYTFKVWCSPVIYGGDRCVGRKRCSNIDGWWDVCSGRSRRLVNDGRRYCWVHCPEITEFVKSLRWCVPRAAVERMLGCWAWLSSSHHGSCTLHCLRYRCSGDRQTTFSCVECWWIDVWQCWGLCERFRQVHGVLGPAKSKRPELYNMLNTSKIKFGKVAFKNYLAMWKL